MNWEDECYLLSKRKFRENANIINVFSLEKGRGSGVVYGGNSRKIRNYLQISNKLFILFNFKNEKRLCYFKKELIKPIYPLYFNDKKRTSALLSDCSILNILLPESQPNEAIFYNWEEFLNSLGLKNWIILYIFFELNLIRELGYDPDLKRFATNISNLTNIKKIKIDNFVYEIPEYLIQKKFQTDQNIIIKKSLYFTRSIIPKKFFTK